VPSADISALTKLVYFLTASITERRRRPIVFKGAFEGKTLVIFALICKVSDVEPYFILLINVTGINRE
jgi:hypothetical protein